MRTAFMHDSAEEVRSRSMFEDVDIEGFILCTPTYLLLLCSVVSLNCLLICKQHCCGKQTRPGSPTSS